MVLAGDVQNRYEKQHDHDWQLGKYYEYQETEIGDEDHKAVFPARAEFVCECGAFKTVVDKEDK